MQCEIRKFITNTSTFGICFRHIAKLAVTIVDIYVQLLCLLVKKISAFLEILKCEQYNFMGNIRSVGLATR